MSCKLVRWVATQYATLPTSSFFGPNLSYRAPTECFYMTLLSPSSLPPTFHIALALGHRWLHRVVSPEMSSAGKHPFLPPSRHSKQQVNMSLLRFTYSHMAVRMWATMISWWDKLWGGKERGSPILALRNTCTTSNFEHLYYTRVLKNGSWTGTSLWYTLCITITL